MLNISFEMTDMDMTRPQGRYHVGDSFVT